MILVRFIYFLYFNLAMFNVERITATSKLAKELVDKGIAKDINEALEMSQGMTRFKDEENILSKGKEEEAGKDVVSDSIKNHVERMRQKLDKMEYFFNDYTQQVDEKLEEISKKVEILANGVDFLRSRATKERTDERPAEEAKQEATEAKQAEQKPVKKEGSSSDIKRRDQIDENIYDLNRVFNNSNFQLMRRMKK